MSQEAIELRMRLQGALEECQRLQEEIRQLKRQLALRDVSSASPAEERVESGLSPQERIEVFRSLFRGREDVYAHRVQFKRDGKWGYVPHGEHDWAALRGVREEDWKSIDRQTRKLFPLTDDVIKRHLTGKMTVGLYPLLGACTQLVCSLVNFHHVLQVVRDCRFSPDFVKEEKRKFPASSKGIRAIADD